MRANIGSQVAVKVGDHAVLTPIVRQVPEGNDLELTLSDRKDFEAVKSALASTTDRLER